MPEYLAPGVYVEEVEIGAKPIEGVGTSTAGFLGQTERGPTDPRLVTGFEQFQRLYGGYIKESYLAYGVDGFFRNGGQRCFIGRIVGDGAKESSKILIQNTEDTIGVKAIGPGKWANRIAVKVEDASLTSEKKPELFKLTVAYWKDSPYWEDTPSTPPDPAKEEPRVIEVYDDLSPDPSSSDNYEKRVNGMSSLIELERVTDERPDNADFELLSEGDDGNEITLKNYRGDPLAGPGERSGLVAFKEVDEIAILCVPDEGRITGLTGDIITHCENMKDRFAILQAKQAAGPVANLRPPVDSKYAAFYYPWIKVPDPLTNTYKLTPPGGYIAGIYARSDQERGVHKAPANEVVRGVSGLQFAITKGDQDILNPRSVNCIRTFIGRGIRVWGARTTSSDPLWKHINVRRLFLFLEESIDEGTKWVVFEPNDEKLWARVRQTITQFLTRVWKDGALMGTTPEEAFFVKCDRTTMTQDDIDNGRIIILIGVAPVKPAVFVIFRIAQWAGGSAATE